jgi:hypothetical protein
MNKDEGLYSSRLLEYKAGEYSPEKVIWILQMRDQKGG